MTTPSSAPGARRVQEQLDALAGEVSTLAGLAAPLSAPELNIAAVNAYCYASHFLLPPPPAAEGELAPYLERLELLQTLARRFFAQPDRFLGGLAEICAGLHLLHFCGVPGALFQPQPALLHVASAEPGAVLLRTLFGKIAPLRLELPAGAAVYIPGAGLSSLLSLPVLAADPGRSYLIQDVHPFPVRAAAHLAQLLGAPNLETRGHSLDQVELPAGSVHLALLSAIHSAGVASIQALADAAAAFLCHGGLVVAACVHITRPGEADAETISELFCQAGLREVQRQTCSYPLEVRDGDPAELLQMTARQLLSPGTQELRQVQQTCSFIAWQRVDG